MVLFNLTVEKQLIHGADKIALAASANKTIALRFHFDGNWREFNSKAAIFRNHSGEYYIIEIKNSVAIIPWEVLKEDYDVELSVIGYEDSTVLTTGAVTLKVSKSLLPEECATKTASETLFDKFKKECIAQAFLDYEDELNAQKRTYEKALLSKQEEIQAEKQNTLNSVAAKDAEIAELNAQHNSEILSLQNQLNATESELAAMTIKADKWDLVDYAVSQKTASNVPLWGASKSVFSLPDMNTSNVTSFSNSSIGSSIAEVGFDLSSATNISDCFSGKGSLKKLRLKNTDNITSMGAMITNSSSLLECEIGNIPKCTSFSRFANGCTSLEKLTIGTNGKLQVLDSAFSNCKALKTIDTEFDFSLVTSVSEAFTNCISLEDIRFKEETISVNLSFNSCVKLSKESMQSIFNGLKTGAGKTLSIIRYTYLKNFPTAAQREVVYNSVVNTKGWTLNLV